MDNMFYTNRGIVKDCYHKDKNFAIRKHNFTIFNNNLVTPFITFGILIESKSFMSAEGVFDVSDMSDRIIDYFDNKDNIEHIKEIMNDLIQTDGDKRDFNKKIKMEVNRISSAGRFNSEYKLFDRIDMNIGCGLYNRTNIDKWMCISDSKLVVFSK